MDKSNRFHNLRFERQAWFLNPRLIAVGIGLVLLSLAWLIIPFNFLFTLIVMPFAVLIWAASYGWRHVLSILLDLIHRLEQL